MGTFSPRRWLTWLTAVLLTGGSSLVVVGSSMLSRARQAVATPMSASELLEDGDRRLAAGDVQGALQAYDDALVLDALDVAAYYRIGVALSYTGDREQATAMFLRVVRQGPAEREEVHRARAWLIQAGVPLPPEPEAR